VCNVNEIKSLRCAIEDIGFIRSRSGSAFAR